MIKAQNQKGIFLWSAQKQLILMVKLSVILIFLNIATVFADGYSQTVTLKADNITLLQAMKSIKKQTGYSYLLKGRDLVRLRKDVDIQNLQLEKALDKLFGNLPASWVIEDGTILIKYAPAKELPLANTSQFLEVQKPDRIITGKVTDQAGSPIAGVSVTVKGSQRGTITNDNGNYSLTVADNVTAVIFSFVGYESVERNIGSQTKIDVVLTRTMSNLDEVMIVAYGKQSRVSFTGAAVDVDMSKVEESPMASFQESLQGNVAGLQMSTQSGQPGAALDVRIRGIGSINASSDPLYVVDGIPVVSSTITHSSIANSSNTIAGINPKDIADITVLKDASATAIYGSRGANGVILITTKQGRAGKTIFDFSAQKGVSKMLMRDMYKPLNTEQLSELMVESRMNIGNTQQEAEDYIYSRIDRTINTDWVDVITQNGKYDDYNISASGGSEKTQFFASLGLHNQEGVIIGIGQKRMNARLNVNHQATEKLKIDFNIAANNQKLTTNSDAGAAANPVRTMVREVPWEPVYNADGSYNTSILLTYNPVGLVKENIRETKIYGILGNLGLTYDFTKDLSFQTKGNIDFNLADEFRFDNPYFGEGRNNGGTGRAYDNKVINYNITNLLKYKWDVNSLHKLDFTLGQEAQKVESSSVYAYVSNYGAPGLTTLANASVYLDATNSKTASSISSYFINANYAFANKYYVNVTGRRDGSSRFGSDVRYANFGSVGVAWNITAEDFMKNAGTLKELKLRASYGINGNQEIGDFASRGLYSTGADYNGEPGYVYTQQSNPGLTWEKNKPFNVGLDFNFNRRISGTIEYYNRTTSNLLFGVPISGTNGITNFLTNIGEMKNSGVEISLNTLNIDNPNGISWTTNFNFTSNKNRITKLQDNETIIDGMFIREVGGDFYTFYMPGFAGADPQTGEALWYTNETKTGTTNKYSQAEPFKQGSGLPKFYAGLSNTINYKSFSLSFLLYLNYGNKVYNYWGRYTNSDGSAQLNDRGNMTQEIYNKRWQKPGDVTYIPKVVWGNTQSGLSTQQSTRFLYDGTYLRLRDVTLSYSLAGNLVDKLGIRELRVYVKGANLLSWIKDDRIDMDPEVGITGQSDLRMPISKQILAGLNLSF